MPRATAFVHTSDVAYLPSYDGQAMFFVATTAVNTSQRLGDLVTVPVLADETYSGSMANSPTGKTLPATRPPHHFFIQVPSVGSVAYLTWDNVTTPVVGGPGMELEPGIIYKFENSGDVLLRGGYKMTDGTSPTARYQVNAKTAFQIIAAGATVLLIWFSD
jgi:hypothetical protein